MSYPNIYDVEHETNMRKVYLEKRSSADCKSGEESQAKHETKSIGNISEKILDLNDIDVFLQREMENCNYLFSDFFTLDTDRSELSNTTKLSNSNEKTSIPKASKEELKITPTISCRLSTSNFDCSNEAQISSSKGKRNSYYCQHSGCSKKYTKLSHLKVNLF